MRSTVENELKRWLSGAERLAIIGVGNPILRDDSVGIKVIQDLWGRVPCNVLLIECETTPENHLHEITEFMPTHVLIIDAAMLGLEAGEAALVNCEDLVMGSTVSTHFLPLKLFCEYIKRTFNAEIKLLLIQPKEVYFGEELSPEVSSSKEEIVKLLLSILSVRQESPNLSSIK